MENFERSGVSPFDCAANVLAIVENNDTQISEKPQVERLYREIVSGEFNRKIYVNMKNGVEKRAYLALLKQSCGFEKNEKFYLEFLKELENLIIRNNLEKLFKS